MLAFVNYCCMSNWLLWIQRVSHCSEFNISQSDGRSDLSSNEIYSESSKSKHDDMHLVRT